MKILCYIAPAFHEVYGLSGNILMIDPSFTIGEIEARRRAIIKQLVADGIAEMNKELPLPTLIKRIAVISSSAAAGYGDFCSQLKGAGLEIAYRMDLFPAAMQGTEAERSVIDALSAIMNSHVDYDVVVIIRGGGSRMDLACFDSYDMASAVAQFPLPVIAGIGHDRDHSVVDMVANTALKTPTAVAEFISEHNEQLLLLLDELKDRLVHAADSIVSSKKSSIDQLSSLLSVSAKAKCSLTKFKLENIISRLKAATSNAITTEKASVQHLEDKVAALDPNRVLDRGYSITTDSDGRTVNSVRQVSSGDTITTYVRDGALTSVLK
jgi:exodeoxyribonuclease VII large subunit